MDSADAITWKTCFFGHEWTKWVRMPITMFEDKRVIGFMQCRECMICGKQQMQHLVTFGDAMTSPYLHLPLRTYAEALAEKREDIRQEAMGNGDAATEEIDELNYLADKTLELLVRFCASRARTAYIGDGVALLTDLVADLRGAARDIAERERNER